MSTPELIAALQRCVSNPSDAAMIGNGAIAGILGANPSQYSKSPALWNAAFASLGIHARYVAFDIDQARVGELLAVVRHSERFLGLNVTVPHKVRVIDFIDELDPGARRIGAVNTIVRACGGRLLGYNTDGEGFIESLLARLPDRPASFLPSLQGMDVLLLGAGGSARAVAFHLADLLQRGRLWISNRTWEHAASLAADINRNGGHAAAIPEREVSAHAAEVGLIVNCTIKGQGGWRRLEDGKVTSLEPYSALAPAHPPAIDAPAESTADWTSAWLAAARADIDENNRLSLDLAGTIAPEIAFYDLIYDPAATVFLRHGRLFGHPVMNGKAMIVNQAVISFCRRICREELRSRGLDTAQTHGRIRQVMYGAWNSA